MLNREGSLELENISGNERSENSHQVCKRYLHWR